MFKTNWKLSSGLSVARNISDRVINFLFNVYILFPVSLLVGIIEMSRNDKKNISENIDPSFTNLCLSVYFKTVTSYYDV